MRPRSRPSPQDSPAGRPSRRIEPPEVRTPMDPARRTASVKSQATRGSPPPAGPSPNGKHQSAGPSEEVRDVTEYCLFLWPTPEDSTVAARDGFLAQSWPWTHQDVRDRDVIVAHHDTDEGKARARQIGQRCVDG